MTIKSKLQILAAVTVVALGIVLLVTVLGLQSMHEADETANRRSSYTLQLLEIKASALSTILLDPAHPDTKTLFAAAEKNIATRQTEVIKVIKRKEIREELEGILAKWTAYDKASQAAIELYGKDSKGAAERINALYQNDFKPFIAALDNFSQARLDEAAKGRQAMQTTSERVFWTIVPTIVVVTLLIVGLVVSLSLSLQNSLRAILSALQPLTEGKLSERLPAAGSDELSQVARGVNTFIGEVQQIVAQVHQGADQVGAASSQLSEAAHQVLLGSESQSTSAAATAAATEELTVSVASIADAADEVRELSNASLEDALQGSRSVKQLHEAINRVKTAVDSIAANVGEFVSNTNRITGMTQQVREIADQTNLLALNAAIEAARAGEQGRGFAVVADEVRKLAERSSLSAGEIASVTQTLNSQSEQVAATIRSGLEALDGSREFVETVARTLEDAGNSVRKASQGVDDVAASVNEQRTASADIARNIESIASMAEENNASSRSSYAAAADLEKLANDLKSAISRFQA